MKFLTTLIFFLLIISCDNSNQTSADINNDQQTVVKKENKTLYKQQEKIDAANIQKSKYIAEIVPEKMTVQEKKERFRYLLVPAVKKVFKELKKQHADIKQAIKSGSQLSLIKRLKKEYKANTNEDLLARLKPHPVSIVLAQAAMESAWATSRFFVEAKNIFGVWSFNKNEPRIAAGEKRGNKTIWLKKYKTIEDAIRDNYRVLARGAAFSKFRQLRLASDNPFELVKGLNKYSELGSKYGKELAAVIRYNKFNKFDL